VLIHACFNSPSIHRLIGFGGLAWLGLTMSDVGQVDDDDDDVVGDTALLCLAELDARVRVR
jgi:hypothetical protein